MYLGDVKKAASHRQLGLPSGMAEALRRHRTRQTNQRLRSEYWEDMDLVFSSEVGTLKNHSNLRREFSKLCEVAGIGKWTPYEMRHTAISVLSDGGVPIESLADLAGHTTTRTTATVYRHRITPVVDAGTEIAESILAKKKA